ncbi:MAG: AAA family ATPase [Candidatus Marinimicrobia bacterium]|nr:AAA family ATPase [Candidatus Neomarinimicrobiota bacterium]
MAHIISIVNHKGGVGKTTTTINLGHAIARKKQRVLLIDMDLQCNTTLTILGLESPQYCLSDLLNPSDSKKIEGCIHPTDYENLYILPNSKKSVKIEMPLITMQMRSGLFLLREKLREYGEKNFDYILIDCPPNLGTFVLCALYTSDSVIIPVETGSRYSLEGLNEATDFVTAIKNDPQGNPKLKTIRALLTKTDLRTLVHKASIQQIKSHYPSNNLFKTTIPINTTIQQAEAMGKTIFQVRSNANSAKAYTALVKEILEFKE